MPSHHLHRRSSCRPLVRAAILAALGLGPVTTAIAGSVSEPPDRTGRAEVAVVGRGEGVPVVLRWRPITERDRVIQIGTRTVPSTLESPGLADPDADIRLSGFMRPPIEKLFTLQGRVSRIDADATKSADAPEPAAGMEIRWRVMDAAARLFGIRPSAVPTPASEPNDDAPTDPADPADAGDGPGRAPSRPSDQPTTEELVSSKVRDADRERGSDPDALRKALDFERITNESLQKVDGAAITQTLGTSGVLPTGTTVRLAAPDRRADFEAAGLTAILSLAQPPLPDEPLAIGGSWTTRTTTMIQSRPTLTEATWTIASFDDDAVAVGVATRAVLRVEYTRRVVDAGDVPTAVRTAIDADGRGEVTITLDEPTRVQGRFVQTPVAPPRPGRAKDVTRMRIDPIESR